MKKRPFSPLVLAMGGLTIVVLVALAVVLNHSVNSNVRVVAIASPTPPTVPPTPSQIPFANCNSTSFGPPLPPQGQPSNPHVYSAAPAMQIDTNKLYQATVNTAKGKFVICLQPALAPLTVNNFVVLARNHFYDGLLFHRVGPSSDTPNIIQGGDPQCKTLSQQCGQGGPGYSFSDETVRQSYSIGTIAMANSGVGSNSNGSQFFIDKDDENSNLGPKNGATLAYNLFGKVSSGMNVVDQIVAGDSILAITVAEQQ